MKKYFCTLVKYPQIALRGLNFLAAKNIFYWTSPAVVVAPPQNIHFRGAKGKCSGQCSFVYFLGAASYILCIFLGEASKKKVVQVEEESPEEQADLNSVCAGLNYFKTGEDPPIRADNEYPAWLWTCLDPVKSYKEIPPELEKAYIRSKNKMKARNNNALKKQLLGKS